MTANFHFIGRPTKTSSNTDYNKSNYFSAPGKVKVTVVPLKASYNWDVGGGYHGEEGLGHTKLFRLQQMV